MALLVSIRFGFVVMLPLVCISALGAASHPNAGGVPGGQSSSAGLHLQDYYDSAQRLQQGGNTEGAAQQYRLFLAAALGELADAYVVAGSYAKAAPLFDESLSLQPDDPVRRMNYASAALSAGDFSHARMLAQKFLIDYPANTPGDAEAHQIAGRALLKLRKDEDARREFEAAVALDPTFQNGYNLAIACLNLNDLKCANGIFHEIEASFGDHAAIHFRFGIAFGESDYQDQAVAELRKAIAEDPHLRGAHYALAAALLAGKNAAPDAPESELKQEVALFPDNALAWAALGKLATSRHENSEAESFLKKAILFDPRNPDAYLYLGQLYVNIDRTADAEQALRNSIRLTTDVSRNRYQVQKAHYLLGRLLARQGRDAEAGAEMKIAQTFLQAQLSEDKDRLSSMLDTTQDTVVIDPVQSVAPSPGDQLSPVDEKSLKEVTAREKELAPAIADSFNNLGVSLSISGSYGAALEYFEQAEAWNPSLDGLDYNWGRAAFSASRFAEAIGPLDRYLRQHISDQGARTALAISEFMTRAYADCVRTVRGADANFATTPQVDFVYAQSLIKTGEVAAGEERLLSLESAHPEIPDTHRALGELYASRAEKEKAQEEFLAASRLDPNNAETHSDLGKLYLASGDPASSIREIELAVRLSPGNAVFHQQLAAAYKAASRGADAEKELRIYATLHSREELTPPADSTTARP